MRLTSDDEGAVKLPLAACMVLQVYKNKYTLDEREESKQGASGVVVFATNNISGYACTTMQVSVASFSRSMCCLPVLLLVVCI